MNSKCPSPMPTSGEPMSPSACVANQARQIISVKQKNA